MEIQNNETTYITDNHKVIVNKEFGSGKVKIDVLDKNSNFITFFDSIEEVERLVKSLSEVLSSLLVTK